VITSATLRIRKAGLVGTDPFTTHQDLVGDIRTGFFAAADALELQDFRAAGSLNSAFVFSSTPVDFWYSGALAPARFAYINRSGLTQFRLRFKLDDDNDLAADYMKFYSGNASTAAVRPQLIITYYLP